MLSRRPTGSEILGAAPGHGLAVPVLRADTNLRTSCQQALLDLQAIQRISGLVGYWKADPQYLFEDSAGTTPASTNGTGPVGCWRRVGDAPVYSPITIANPGFDTDTDWSKGTGWTIAGGVATKSAGTASSLSQAISVIPGTMYLVTFTITVTSGLLIPKFTGGTEVVASGVGVTGAYEAVLVATTGNNTLTFYGNSTFAGTLDTIALFAVSNTPALQTTTANKPILRKTPTTGVYWADSNTTTSALNVALSDTVLGLRNLMTYSEDFSNAAWVKTRVTAIGGAYADATGVFSYSRLTEDTSSSATHTWVRSGNVTVGSQYAVSFEIKADTRPGVYIMLGATTAGIAFNASTNTFSLIGVSVSSYTSTLLSNGAYKVVFIATAAAASVNFYLFDGTSYIYTGDGASGLYLGKLQVELGSVATDYQKITSVPSYLTLARSTPEGVTFTENVSITSTYNITPSFAFNSDVALFNRVLTATEKALITRYMTRAVPMLGNNVVKNGTFDTDTTGWSTDATGLITPVDGMLRIANNGGSYRAATQYSISVSKTYLGKCVAKGDGTAFPRFVIGSTVYKDGTTATSLQSLSIVSHLSVAGGVSLMCRSTVTTGVYTEFDNVTAQEIL